MRTRFSSILLMAASCALVQVVVLGCGQRELDRVRRAAPQLDAEFAQHLVQDDDTQFWRTCEELGAYRLIRIAQDLLGTPYQQSSLEAYRKVCRILDPYALRLARAMAEQYAHERLFERIEADQSHSIEQRFALALADAEVLDERFWPSDPVQTVTWLKRRYLDAQTGGRVVLRSRLALAIGESYSKLNDLDRQLYWMHEANEALLAAGNINRACQNLGQVGEIYLRLGQLDSMRTCYDRAYEIALRSRISDQAARILEFYGNEHWNRGQLTAAFDYYGQAIQLCRELKGQRDELRFLLNIIDAHADFECWDVVQKDLARVHVLAGSFEGTSAPAPADVMVMEARSLMGLGRIAAADSIYARAFERIAELGVSAFGIDVLWHWGVGLLESGLPKRCLLPLERGLSLSEEPFPDRMYEAKLRVEVAKAHFELGELDSVSVQLDRFDTLAGLYDLDRRLPSARLEWDALRVRLALARQDDAAARLALHCGIDRLRNYVQPVDASSQGYLRLRRVDALHAAMHEFLRADPNETYEFELLWRRAPLELGAHARKATISADVFAQWRRRIDAMSDGATRSSKPSIGTWQQLAPGDTHLLYWLDGRRIVRWTATHSAVQRDVLDISADRLRAMTLRVSEQLATPHAWNAVCEPQLVSELRELARALLPEIPRSQTETRRRVLISPDGFLNALAFEALNLADDAYEPLLQDHDVLYLRHLRARSEAKSDSERSIAVVEPTVPRSIQRRHEGIRPLNRGQEEIRQLATLLPGTTVLTGLEASKPRLESTWQDARVLYFATHVFRDREAPYLSYLALAAPEQAAGESYLGVSDIRAADLRACELVVLSACASGAPYVARTYSGVSLASAFLDAGAESAIRTLWDVRDEDAQRIMESYLHSWLREGKTPLRALGDVRRALMGSREQPAHPFVWAAYGIESVRIPNE